MGEAGCTRSWEQEGPDPGSGSRSYVPRDRARLDRDKTSISKQGKWGLCIHRRQLSTGHGWAPAIRSDEQHIKARGALRATNTIQKSMEVGTISTDIESFRKPPIRIPTKYFMYLILFD